MYSVPREEFVAPSQREQAYGDYPLPIGYGQTISQPYIVARMIELLDLKGDEKVLEIGTGSGYQAAVLAEIAGEVFTVELIPELARDAKQRLAKLGYDNVHVRIGDGNEGWPEHAPYDAVIVAAAARGIPPALVEQLKDGGVLVVPVGPQGGFQVLKRLHKRNGEVTVEDIFPVAFVPLVKPSPDDVRRPS